MPEQEYSARALRPLRSLFWVGSTLDDLRACPAPVCDVVGKALFEAQQGEFSRRAKRLKGDLRGLIELVDDFDRNTYRAVIATNLADVIYVLHVYQKKSTHGIATPRRDLARIKSRLTWARWHARTTQEGSHD